MRLKTFAILTILLFTTSVASAELIPLNEKRSINGNKAEVDSTGLRIKKWGDEASIKLFSPFPNQRLTLEADGKYTQENNNIKVMMYQLPASPGMEDGGVEYAVRFKKKPGSNTYSIPIDTTGLRWLYQAELTEQEKMGWVFNEQTGQEEFVQVRFRADNVIGSYAIYHQNKKDNQYGIGKAFHLYRPKLIDANGEEAWCSFNANAQETSQLVVTCPQDFLNTKVYPITLDPTIGDTNGGASCATGVGSRYSKFTTTEDSYLYQVLAKTCENAGTARSSLNGVYVDTASAPAALGSCAVLSNVGGSSCTTCNNSSYAGNLIKADEEFVASSAMVFMPSKSLYTIWFISFRKAIASRFPLPPNSLGSHSPSFLE
jgi:hypothetical protein